MIRHLRVCDRCGTEEEVQPASARVHSIGRVVDHEGSGAKSRHLSISQDQVADLCQSCIADLRDWMHPAPDRPAWQNTCASCSKQVDSGAFSIERKDDVPLLFCGPDHRATWRRLHG